MDNSPLKTRSVEIKGKTKNGKLKVVRYDRSFLSRVIQNAKAKEFYNDIKNYCLSFEKVKARLAWNAEGFVAGVDVLVRLVMRGDALCVLLALSPDAYSQKDYPHKDYSDQREYKSTPFFLPIRNAAEYKIARRLVGEAFSSHFVYALDFPTRTDYVAAFPSAKDDVLVKKGFIKKSETEMTESEAKKAIAAALKDEAEEERELEEFALPPKRQPKKKKSAEEEPEEVEFELEEEDTVFELAEDGTLIEVRYDRSFTARIIQNQQAKEYYSEIKNHALSFVGIKSKISWRADRFYLGRKPFFLAKVRGKTLCLYLALDPAEFESRIYHHVDVSDRKCYAKHPMMIRIRSSLGLRKAERLVSLLAERLELTQEDLAKMDYAALYPYEETEPLISRGLIKRTEYKPGEAPAAGTEEEVEEVLFELEEEQATEQSDEEQTLAEPEERTEETAKEPFSEEPTPSTDEEERAQEFVEEDKQELVATSAEEGTEEDTETPEESVEETSEDEVEEVEFELVQEEPDEEEKEEITSGSSQEEGEGEEDAEEVSFELVPETVEDQGGGMESYGAEEREGRYVTLRKYVRGFTAKMRQGDQDRKDYYAKIKATLLSYKGVKLSESFSGDTFKKGSRILLKSRIRGKTLCLFFALDPDNYRQTIYRQQYKGDTKAYAATPMMVRVKSEQGLARALRLVEEMERNYLLLAGDPVTFEEVRHTYLFEETESLVQKGLIKTKLVTVTEYEAEELLKKKSK